MLLAAQISLNKVKDKIHALSYCYKLNFWHTESTSEIIVSTIFYLTQQIMSGIESALRQERSVIIDKVDLQLA